MPGPVINRADVAALEVSEADIRFSRRRLGLATGTARIGVSLYEVAPGARQMPVHVHGDEEEIFYVLGGEGLSWQRGAACVVAAGDVVVHAPCGDPHTFLAGDLGLELVAFASGSDTSITYLPRARVMWCGPRWVPVDSPHPFKAEAAAGPLERPEPGERPAGVVAQRDIEPLPGSAVRALGHPAGAVKAGLNHVTLPPDRAGTPPHCHSLEEELFIVLEGSGTLVLGHDAHPLRAGDVVARPPSTGVTHQLRAGEAGLTYLAYGTREPGDGVYYPETATIRLRGLGVSIGVAARQ